MKHTENFIEHEIRIRLLEELMKKVDHKLNWMVGLIMGSIVLPVLLRSTGWI